MAVEAQVAQRSHEPHRGLNGELGKRGLAHRAAKLEL